ncbi:50S ribosomal protein L31e [Halobacterium sp. CBA1126]|uniref:50S ribosomal protein L31e n=1 Tax=Halobacterium TaxID=2239 RepID=UPI0012FAE692|nr:50S ribosomal protein L31e [Halobacterium sp. CBA1126]MUV60103.1 50S ribosomal protein L31e [Halobacterium sp. CBA1126]
MSASDFEERIVTVPLRDVTKVPNHERAGQAMTIIREHLAKHFAVDEEEVRLDPSINEAIWSEGQKNPPRKVRVHAARFVEDGETVVEAEYEE